MSKSELLILADADVQIHFFRGNQLKLLPKILSRKIGLVDVIVQELKAGPNLYPRIMNEIGDEVVEIPLVQNAAVFHEWMELVAKDIGKGEAGCMALARKQKHFIASSNLSDINLYCKENRIRVYTTMDLLCLAHRNNLIDADDCEAFVSDVLLSGSRLPCRTFAEYLTQNAENVWTSYDLQSA